MHRRMRGSCVHDGLPPRRVLYRVPPVKRVTLFLPLVVGLLILIGFLLEGQRSGGDLPSITPARPPVFQPLQAPTGAATLRGQLVSPEGTPVADASVYVRSGEAPAWAYTDAEGAFLLEGLQAEATTAAVLAWGFPPTEFEVLPGPEPVILTLPPRSDAVPGLPDIVRADLLGRVLHPLGLERSYEIVLVPSAAPHLLQGPVQVRAQTDPEGHFRFEGLAVGHYQTLILPLWAQGGAWPDLAEQPTARFEHTLDAEPRDLRLAAGALTGLLRDPAGLPLEGAMVLLTRADDPARVWPPVLSGPSGQYSLVDLPPADYLLEVRAGEGVRTGVPVRIEAGQQLDRPLTTLRIREDRALPTEE